MFFVASFICENIMKMPADFCINIMMLGNIDLSGVHALPLAAGIHVVAMGS